jgi:hypothetical protein
VRPPPNATAAHIESRTSLARDAASIRAIKQSSSELYRATTDAGDANRMERDSGSVTAAFHGRRSAVGA